MRFETKRNMVTISTVCLAFHKSIFPQKLSCLINGGIIVLNIVIWRDKLSFLWSQISFQGDAIAEL